MSDKDRPFHNPFEALGRLTGTKPAPGNAGRADPPAADVPAGPSGRDGATSAQKPVPRAVVRLERSGRGGKEVTVVEHLAIPPAARRDWLKALRTALGCGGTVEGDRLVLQGDQRRRLPALLEGRGVRKVTLG